jgi:excisionase family DNA binding protein
MNKQEAAEFLNVSVRAVERYTQQGRLSVTYARGRTRPVAEYRAAELEALRAEIQANLYHQRPAHEKTNPANPEQPSEIGGVSPSQALQRQASEQGIAILSAAIRDALGGEYAARNGLSDKPSIADLSHKLTLSLPEAARVSGLSANHLRGAIHDGKLKAKIVGRGWKVKPEELRAYVGKVLK